MTEAQIQGAVFDNLRSRGMPGVVFWHTPNDRSSRNKAGYRAGVADVSVVYRGEYFGLELKVPKGITSDEQIKFRDDVKAAGGNAHIAHGLDEALACLEAWGLLRKAA